MKTLLTCIGFFLSFNCIGQIYSEHDFTQYPIPIVNSDAWYKLDTLKMVFNVSIVEGHLRIEKKDQMLSAKEYSFAQGKLLALDFGEWGGGLYYKADHTLKQTFVVNGESVSTNNRLENYSFILRKNPVLTQIQGKHLLLAPGNTAAVVPYKGKWLFIQGSHIDPNHGSLSQLVVQKDSFTVTEILKLDAYALAITVYDDEIYIATFDGLYGIKNGKTELFLTDLFWKGLYPNSIAIDGHNIYVGMRAGYAQIDKTKMDVRFYKYGK